MNRAVLVAATAMATALVTVPATTVHAAPATVTLVPYPIDSSNQAAWWSPLDTWHTPATTTRTWRSTSPAVRRHAPRRHRPPRQAGDWTKLPVMNGAARPSTPTTSGTTSHRSPVTAGGRFHVLASMHNNAWRYFRPTPSAAHPHQPRRRPAGPGSASRTRS